MSVANSPGTRRASYASWDISLFDAGMITNWESGLAGKFVNPEAELRYLSDILQTTGRTPLIIV
jgi:hypothetical protein